MFLVVILFTTKISQKIDYVIDKNLSLCNDPNPPTLVMRNFILYLTLIFLMLPLSAQVRLAPIYTDNMVIEQNSSVPIWGSAGAASIVTIITSWAPMDTIRVTVGSNGQWKTTIKTPAADLIAHTIKCNNITLENVMLGHVWLCSGQSNMEWSINHSVLNGEQEAAAANYPNIRIFKVPLRGADTPQLSLDAQWVACTPQTMRTASAVGYFFARTLLRELNVPIGIISSAWGGTPAEPWMPAEAFDSQMIDNLCADSNQWRPNEPSQTYNQMIHPLVPFTLSGVIWYQGETNRLWAAHYDHLMQGLINSWRKKFEQKLPFYFVQIAPFNYTNNKDTFAAELREAQQKTADATANTGMVVISDLVNDVNNIHPLNKQDVGRRLANFALAELYNKPMEGYKSPTYRSQTIKGNKIVVELNNPTNKISCRGEQIEGFKIAGQDGVFTPAQAQIVDNNKIEVWSRQVKEPIQVRYCFDDTTLGNLQSETGLPVAPFRTGK